MKKRKSPILVGINVSKKELGSVTPLIHGLVVMIVQVKMFTIKPAMEDFVAQVYVRFILIHM